MSTPASWSTLNGGGSTPLRPLVKIKGSPISPGKRATTAPAISEDVMEANQHIAAVKSDLVLLQNKIDQFGSGPRSQSGISTAMSDLETILLRVNPREDERKRKDAKLLLYELMLSKTQELVRLLVRTTTTLPSTASTWGGNFAVSSEDLPVRQQTPSPLGSLIDPVVVRKYPGSPAPSVGSSLFPTNTLMRQLIALADNVTKTDFPEHDSREPLRSVDSLRNMATLAADGTPLGFHPHSYSQSEFPPPTPCMVDQGTSPEFEPTDLTRQPSNLSLSTSAPMGPPLLDPSAITDTSFETDASPKMKPGNRKPVQMGKDKKSKGRQKSEPEILLANNADLTSRVTVLEAEKEALAQAYLKLDKFIQETIKSDPMKHGFHGVDEDLMKELSINPNPEPSSVAMQIAQPAEDPESDSLSVVSSPMKERRRSVAPGKDKGGKPTKPPSRGAKDAKGRGKGDDVDSTDEAKSESDRLLYIIGAQALGMRKLQEHILESRALFNAKRQQNEEEIAQLNDTNSDLHENLRVQRINFEKEVVRMMDEIRREPSPEPTFVSQSSTSNITAPVVPLSPRNLAWSAKQNTAEQDLHEAKGSLVKKDRYIFALQQQAAASEELIGEQKAKIQELEEYCGQKEHELAECEHRLQSLTKLAQGKCRETDNALDSLKREQEAKEAMEQDMVHQREESQTLAHELMMATKEVSELCAEKEVLNQEIANYQTDMERMGAKMQQKLKESQLQSADIEFRYKQLLIPLTQSVDHFLKLAMSQALGEEHEEAYKDLKEIKAHIANAQVEWSKATQKGTSSLPSPFRAKPNMDSHKQIAIHTRASTSEALKSLW